MTKVRLGPILSKSVTEKPTFVFSVECDDKDIINVIKDELEYDLEKQGISVDRATNGYHDKEKPRGVERMKTDLFVGGYESNFNDDIKDKCNKCGHTIYYRPYNKDISDKKVCLSCAVKIGKKQPAQKTPTEKRKCDFTGCEKEYIVNFQIPDCENPLRLCLEHSIKFKEDCLDD